MKKLVMLLMLVFLVFVQLRGSSCGHEQLLAEGYAGSLRLKVIVIGGCALIT